MPKTGNVREHRAGTHTNAGDGELPVRPVKPSPAKKQRWEWNGRLALLTVVVGAAVIVLSVISYRYHSTTAETTFLSRAEAAADNNKYDEQVKWLGRYLLLKPDDLDAVLKMALASDAAADVAKPDQLRDAIDDARSQLSGSIARLGDNPNVKELRGRLIERLLQLGGLWFREAERQVVAFRLESDDPQATRWLARSLIGQINSDVYEQRRSNSYSEQDEYWDWLANQKVGDVLAVAIERNEQDIELIADFLDAYHNRPEIFDDVDDQSERVKRVVKTLRSNTDSRSKLILYQFDWLDGRRSQATEELFEAAQEASNRLAKLDASALETTGSGIERPSFFWDYLVVYEAAKRAAQQNAESQETEKQNAEQAAQWFDALMALKLEAIPRATTENVYLDAGRLQLVKGNPDRAIEIWQQGLNPDDPNNLDLLGSIAVVRGQNESPELAAEATSRFRDAIELASGRLSRTSVYEMTQATRNAVSRRISAAKWRLNTLEASQAIRDGNRSDAISRLETAMIDSTDIDARDRLRVAIQLAALYWLEGSWDQAGVAFSRAADMDPSNAQLRVQAADAWLRSGNRVEALEQRRIASLSDSAVMQVASAEALFSYQLRLLPKERDFSGVRAAVKRIRNRLTATDASTGKNLPGDHERAARRLEILEISLPPTGISAEEHLRSPTMADAVAKLAVKYSDDESIQAFAAERLAQSGRDEASQQAIERLESIVGPSSSSLAIVKAQIEATQGDNLAASERLIAQAVIDENRADELLQIAAMFAAAENVPELAYQALSKIPEDRQPMPVLFLLAKLAASLPEDSALLNVDGKQLSPLELSLRLEDQLRKREGSQGSYWRFLKVSRLIDELRSDSNSIQRSDPRLKTAQKLVRDILALRPNWGEAISLEGWLSAIEGKPEKAIEELRRGIAAGDSRLQTRQRLWEQLISLDRNVEAEEEIRRASIATNLDVDKYATTRIQLAQRQGNYERSLEIAKSECVENPDDFLGYVMLCHTAIVAANEAPTPEDRARLFVQAREAIDTAQELADQDKPVIYSARLRLELADGGEQNVRAEISRIRASQLDEYSKLTLEGRALVDLKDDQAALPLLQRANELKPSSQTLLELADLYRRQGRPDEQIASLRKAQRQNPNDEKLRNRLALDLVTRDGQNVDWSEISELLSSDDGVTPNNRFVYAIFLGKEGSPEQHSEAIGILRELIDEDNNFSDDASRFLVGLLQERADDLAENQDAIRDQLLSEIRSIHQSLVERASPQVADLYRYASFLLNLGEREDLLKVGGILRKLRSMPEGTLASLEIAVRHAVATGRSDSLPKLVSSWSEEASDNGMIDDKNVATIAGACLLKLGFTDAGLEYFERSYRENPEMLPGYIVALRKVGRVQESIDVCSDHFQNHGDVASAALLVDSLLAHTRSIDPRHEEIIRSAVQQFPDNALLLEGVATLRFQQEQYDKAIVMYQRVREIEPLRLRTLNNLAMAFSETKGRAAEGIEPIDLAIKLAGEVPELLDTKGVVLRKSGRLSEAQAVIAKAIAQSDEPRYQYHLIVTLLAQNKNDEAKRAWQSLDLKKLDPSGLTPQEREELESMTKNFAP